MLDAKSIVFVGLALFSCALSTAYAEGGADGEKCRPTIDPPEVTWAGLERFWQTSLKDSPLLDPSVSFDEDAYLKELRALGPYFAALRTKIENSIPEPRQAALAQVTHDDTYFFTDVVNPESVDRVRAGLPAGEPLSRHLVGLNIGANPPAEAIALLPQDVQEAFAQRYEKLGLRNGDWNEAEQRQDPTFPTKFFWKDLGLDRMSDTEVHAFFVACGKTPAEIDSLKADYLPTEKKSNGAKEIVNLYHQTWESAALPEHGPSDRDQLAEWEREKNQKQIGAFGGSLLIFALQEAEIANIYEELDGIPGYRRAEILARAAYLLLHWAGENLFSWSAQDAGYVTQSYQDLDEDKRTPDRTKVVGHAQVIKAEPELLTLVFGSRN